MEHEEEDKLRGYGGLCFGFLVSGIVAICVMGVAVGLEYFNGWPNTSFDGRMLYWKWGVRISGIAFVLTFVLGGLAARMAPWGFALKSGARFATLGFGAWILSGCLLGFLAAVEIGIDRPMTSSESLLPSSVRTVESEIETKSVIIMTVVIVTLIGTAWYARRWVRRNAAQEVERRCYQCGHLRSKIATPLCPECGKSPV